jgi:hypothetical protein
MSTKNNTYAMNISQLIRCISIVRYGPVARQHNDTRQEELCFVCGLREATIEEAVFFVWLASSNNRGSCVFCALVRAQAI